MRHLALSSARTLVAISNGKSVCMDGRRSTSGRVGSCVIHVEYFMWFLFLTLWLVAALRAIKKKQKMLTTAWCNKLYACTGCNGLFALFPQPVCATRPHEPNQFAPSSFDASKCHFVPFRMDPRIAMELRPKALKRTTNSNSHRHRHKRDKCQYAINVPIGAENTSFSLFHRPW